MALSPRPMVVDPRTQGACIKSDISPRILAGSYLAVQAEAGLQNFFQNVRLALPLPDMCSEYQSKLLTCESRFDLVDPRYNNTSPIRKMEWRIGAGQ